MVEHILDLFGESQDDDGFPILPREGDPEPSQHRDKHMEIEIPVPCCIARKVGRKEFISVPKAMEAMDNQWTT